MRENGTQEKKVKKTQQKRMNKRRSKSMRVESGYR